MTAVTLPVNWYVGPRARQDRAVAGERRAREHAGARAPQRQRVDPGPLERLPGHLEQQPLLRVHGQGLTRADAEEARVEFGRVVNETAGPQIRGPGFVGVPAPVPREAGDRVRARLNQVPQPLGIRGPAGETAAHADDRNRLLLARFHRAQALARLLELGGRLLQVVEELFLTVH